MSSGPASRSQGRRPFQKRHVAVAMISPRNLAEEICSGYYGLASYLFHAHPEGRNQSVGESVGMAVLRLNQTTSLNDFVEYAKAKVRQAKSVHGFENLLKETDKYMMINQPIWKTPGTPWDVGMNPGMERLWLPENLSALQDSRNLDGEEQALISVIEYPYPPKKYYNLDCLGLIAHGTIDREDENTGEDGEIRTARREIFEEAGVYVPLSLFDRTLLPPLLSFKNGPFPMPNEDRCLSPYILIQQAV